jgi:hypothetical protein
MKKDNIYLVLIYFFIFTAIKKIYDVTIDYKFPTYEEKIQAPDSLKFLFTIRNIFAAISILFILFILFSFKLNTFISTIVIIFLIQNIVYFLTDKRYIKYLIDEKYINMGTIIFIDGTFNTITNVMVLLYAFYILANIFRTTG